MSKKSVASKPKRDDRIAVGISSCLLGQEVRWDGGHKRNRYLTDILGEYFRFVAVCPELEVGMGVPRESVRLVGDIESPRMVGNKTGEDWTERMNQYSEKRVNDTDLKKIHGFILKKDSPSCGMARVRVYDENGMPDRKGVGLFAAKLLERYPYLPIEEEGRLNDLPLRENFIVRVFAYHRLQQNLLQGRFSRGSAVRFHTIHKYLIMAHSQPHYRDMGKLVAAIKSMTPIEFKRKYARLYMEALTYKTTRRKNTNVLQHILGFLKKDLNSDEKADIIRVIDDYHAELVPLIVPLTLLRHYVYIHNIEYIKDQVYLNPHPKELMLRNHV